MQSNPITRSAGTPIVFVDGYGITLAVENGHLLIRDGFPPKRREIRLSRGRSNTKRIVVRAPAGMLSIAALDWCSQMGIPIAFLGSDARLISCHMPAASPDGPLKRAQAFAAVTDAGVAVAQRLLRIKLESQLAAIRGTFPDLGIVDAASPAAQRAIREIEATIAALPRDTELRDLLAHEGYAARLYWELLSGEPLPWATWAMKRIPDHWLRIWPREYGAKERVRDATDPFNSILNYGYTLLEVETRIAATAQGLDPDLGLLHVDSRLRESLIYDLQEPIRTKVDTLSLAFCRRANLRPHMFIELRDGVVRLDPDFAREYADWLMPQLRTPTATAAADFAQEVRRIVIPYRLTADRTAERKPAARIGSAGPCGYCGQPLKKTGLKFCSRDCYLRHSVEIARPIEKAQAKLADMRVRGLSPGHGGEAAKKRGAAVAESNRRRSLGLTAEEYRTRKTAKARERREQRRHI
jgi:CRISP-associated protein Cas1